ncbi:MAG TPA: hypothetical protein ENH24_04360 [Nitrospirae bacterium]|nr:hypothetical protein [Nitrospirota bacterium]
MKIYQKLLRTSIGNRVHGEKNGKILQSLGSFRMTLRKWFAVILSGAKNLKSSALHRDLSVA